jgi:CheY-like chemotaxis protein
MLVERAAAGQPEARLLDDLDQAQQWLASSPQAPELIVLAQSRPGEFADAAIEALRRSAPLARVWRVVGTWCEGEGRSAPPPAGCASAYWHQWPARWGRELARTERGDLPSWNLPLTASPEERMLELDAEPPARGAGPVAVFARHPASAAALADVCRLGGYEPTTVDAACPAPFSSARAGEHKTAGDCPDFAQSAEQGTVGRAVAWPMVGTVPFSEAVLKQRLILWDATPEQIVDPAAIQKLRASCGPGPIVAVLGFARADDCRRAAEAGVAAIVTKPYLIHDLLWQLARLQGTGAA